MALTSQVVRIQRAPNGHRRLEMLTPIYNERSCSQAACHAHPAGVHVLGVLDLALNLESVDHEVASMKFRVLLVTAVEITLISLFIIFFTRRFLGRPIEKLIEGTKAVSQMELDQPIDIVGSSEELDELARSLRRDARPPAHGARTRSTSSPRTWKPRWKSAPQQLKAAQKKLLQSDRLASLGQLSASVAHEINNPVSGVLNLSMLHAAHAEGRRHSARAHRGVPQIPGAGHQRNRARGPDCLRPAGVLAALQAAASRRPT